MKTEKKSKVRGRGVIIVLKIVGLGTIFFCRSRCYCCWYCYFFSCSFLLLLLVVSCGLESLWIWNCEWIRKWYECGGMCVCLFFFFWMEDELVLWNGEREKKFNDREINCWLNGLNHHNDIEMYATWCIVCLYVCGTCNEDVWVDKNLIRICIMVRFH